MSAPPSPGQTAAISAALRSSPCRDIFGLTGFDNATLFPQLGEEVHFEGAGELRRRAEGDVDVALQHLRDVRARDVHPLRERGLIQPQLLHPLQHLPEEERADSIDAAHSVVSSSCQWLVRNLEMKPLSMRPISPAKAQISSDTDKYPSDRAKSN